MSKNPWLLYGSRGKVGNIVLQRNKGVTTVRELVVPNNPRTKKQQLQRSRFGYLAKFYAEGVKQFFKFSFENKKSNESDYNAFMRENKGNTYLASRSMLDNFDGCAFGRYRMTSGSIPGYGDNVSWSNENGRLEIVATGVTDAMSWGEISAILIAQNPGWENGDIVTLLTVADRNPAATFCDNVADAIANGSMFKNNQGSIWRFTQLNINTADTSAPSAYGVGVVAGKLYVQPSASEPYSSTLAGGTMVISRPTDGGLVVSDSYLELGEETLAAIEAINADPAWADYVGKSMMATAESILQGSLLPQPAPAPASDFVTTPSQFAGTSSLTKVATYVSRESNPYEIKVDINGDYIPYDSIMNDVSGVPIPNVAISFDGTTDNMVVLSANDEHKILLQGDVYNIGHSGDTIRVYV